MTWYHLYLLPYDIHPGVLSNHASLMFLRSVVSEESRTIRTIMRMRMRTPTPTYNYARARTHAPARTHARGRL